jgi:hypothetical protein
MELVGEEKRIQALFRELRLEDEHVAPRFATMWHRAQAGSRAPRRTFNVAFVVATALLLCALFSLAWLTKQWQRSQQASAAVTAVNSIPSVGAATEVKREVNVVSSSDLKRRSSSKSLSMKLAVRRHAEMLAARRAEIRNAAAISSWQSPTTALLRSPGDAVLTSLPQLNKSVDELKSFLPSRSN